MRRAGGVGARSDGGDGVSALRAFSHLGRVSRQIVSAREGEWCRYSSLVYLRAGKKEHGEPASELPHVQHAGFTLRCVIAPEMGRDPLPERFFFYRLDGVA